MPRKRPSATRAAQPRAIDDFTRIHGIGPVIHRHLHRAGIRTFAQLAKLSSEAIASRIPNLSVKQVNHQHWIQQARELASSKAAFDTPEKDCVLSPTRQHYESFTLEFLLGEKNKIRRMQIVHVQSRDVDTWTKWDAERLIDFLARHTAVRLPHPKEAFVTTAKPKLTSLPSISTEQHAEVIAKATAAAPINQSEEKIHLAPSHEISESMPQIMSASAENPPSATGPQPVVPSAVSAIPASRIRLLEWKTLNIKTNQPLHNLSHDQAFNVDLILDLTNAPMPETSQIDLTALLYAKRLGNGPRQVIGETHHSIPYTSVVDLTISNATLPQGLYRLEAFLTLIPKDSSPLSRSGLHASFEGGLLQVY